MRFQNIALVLFLFISLGCEEKKAPEVITVTKAELTAVLEEGDIQLLDVRRPEEYDQGHIDGAVNVNVLDTSDFKKDLFHLISKNLFTSIVKQVNEVKKLPKNSKKWDS